MNKALPKTSVGYWLTKVKKPAGSGLYGVQIAYRGVRTRFPLETANREAAAEKARDRYLSMVAVGLDGTLVRFKPRTAKVVPSSTVGSWIEAVKATSEFRPSTLNNYAVSLRLIASSLAEIGDQPALDEYGVQKRDSKNKPLTLSRFDYKAGEGRHGQPR